MKCSPKRRARSLDELRKYIDNTGAIRNLLKIERLVERCINGLSIQSVILPRGFRLFRAVKWDEAPKDIASIAAPPPSLVTTFGRAHHPGEPAFYSSTARNAVIFESRLEAKQRFVIGHWDLKKDLRALPLGHSRLVYDKHLSQRDANSVISRTGIDSKDLDILDYLSSLFCGEINSEIGYRISSAIARAFLNVEGSNAILYPAVSMRCNADNVVMRPTDMQDYLELKHAEYCQMENWSGTSGKMTILGVSRRLSESDFIWEARSVQFRSGQRVRIFKDGQVLKVFNLDIHGIPAPDLFTI